MKDPKRFGSNGRLTRTYRKWASMIARCTNPTHPAYGYYGARGVQVCPQWLASYDQFLQDMGPAPDGHWIDRIDNAKGYEPGNVRWVTPKESAANRAKGGPKINPNSLMQRAKRAGLPYARVVQRVRGGWPIERALSIPIQPPGGMKLATKEEFGLL